MKRYTDINLSLPSKASVESVVNSHSTMLTLQALTTDSSAIFMSFFLIPTLRGMADTPLLHFILTALSLGPFYL